jgi:hypothetical protein
MRAVSKSAADFVLSVLSALDASRNVTSAWSSAACCSGGATIGIDARSMSTTP